MLIFNIAITSTAFIYETVMIAMLGRTVGKFALGTRVVRLVDGQPPGDGRRPSCAPWCRWRSAPSRAIGVFLSVLVLLAGVVEPAPAGSARQGGRHAGRAQLSAEPI